MATQGSTYSPSPASTSDILSVSTGTWNSGDHNSSLYPTWSLSSSYSYSAYHTGAITDGVVETAGYIKEVEIFLIILFIILNIYTIVGNVLALTVFSRIPLSKTVSVIFFTSMAVADLCNGIFVMPFSVYSLLNENRYIAGLQSDNTTLLNNELMNYCTFAGIITNTCAKAALFTLILICFDRFISVHDALRVHTIMTVRNSAIMVTVSWVLALLLAVFPYFVPDAVTADNKAVSHNYRYIDVSTQCTYRVEWVYDMRDLYTKKFIHAMQNRESIVYPVNVNVSYFFINILPIVIPTYLIVFFCVAVIVILRRIFNNSKRIIQQIEPPEQKKNSFRESLQLKELASLSFKRKASEKPHIIKKIPGPIEAGYTELHKDTVSDQEGQVIRRNQKPCRRITLVNMNATKNSQIRGDRWSQISVKSLRKKTKADHQKKAINTVIMMLLFFVFCYALEWICILSAVFIYAGATHNFFNTLSPHFSSYFFTLITIMKYLNCAGNPFLYYFRMSQFQKEARVLGRSFSVSSLMRQRSSSSGRLIVVQPRKGYTPVRQSKSTSSNSKNKNRIRSNHRYPEIQLPILPTDHESE